MRTNHSSFEIIIFVSAFIAVILFTVLPSQNKLFLNLFYLLSSVFIISKAVRLYKVVGQATRIIWVLSIVTVLASCITMVLKPGSKTANYLWCIGMLAFSIAGAKVLQPERK